MKTFQKIKNAPPWHPASGFTLVEMMMVTGIFLFIFVGVMVGVQLFGLRISTLSATKLVATQGARTALNQMRDSIREGKIVYVGNCGTIGTSTFTLLSATNVQVGNALIVYPTTNTTWYTVYYLDTNTSTNILTQFNVSNSAVVYTNQLASYITNINVFDAESWSLDGTTLVTNYTSIDNRELIHVTLQFSQWEYPIAFVGGHDFNAFDYYQLRTKVFRRAWN